MDFLQYFPLWMILLVFRVTTSASLAKINFQTFSEQAPLTLLNEDYVK